MNSIITNQNKPDFIRLLRAKSVAYDTADFYQNVDLTFIAVGMLLPFVYFFFPTISLVYVLLPYGFLTFLMSFLIDSKRNQLAEIGAKIQQEFDCSLYGFDNKENVDPEIIIRLSSKYKRDEKNLQNWYSWSIKPEINQSLAILLCQRSNLHWTISIRTKLIYRFVSLAAIYYTITIVLGCFKDITLFKFILAFVVPSLSMMKFVIKSYYKQSELVTALRIQLEKTGTLLRTYINSGTEPQHEELISIQAEIFKNRKKPEVLPYWLYKITKNSLGEETDRTIEIFVEKIMKK